MSRPPSGEQIELSHGDQQAVVVEVGAGLRSYRVGGREIIDGYGVEEICSAARAQPLTPWPNRVQDGVYEWSGTRHQLDITEPELNNAIHGLTMWRNWTVSERTNSRVVLSQTLHPVPGYPFALAIEANYELADDGLTVTLSARNEGEVACPYGQGWHPYFRPPGLEQIDECVVTLPAATRLLVDERLIPVGAEATAGTAFDFRAARTLGDLKLDDCFLDLDRGEDGLTRATVAGPAGSTTIWADETYGYLQVFSGDALEQPRRRRGLAIEPMTCAANAFVSGVSLIQLEPGERSVSRCGITVA
ncbi:MAG TPA: aldose 1-epimerase family protein [Solirubrobacteraceae bacterium]|nr:aldose 1-epimerase family protein [Solirubrobacteraceae bacterium]